MDYPQNREDVLISAREKIGEAVEELEEVLPDTAEELSWIWETLREEIRATRIARTDARLQEGSAL